MHGLAPPQLAVENRSVAATDERQSQVKMRTNRTGFSRYALLLSQQLLVLFDWIRPGLVSVIQEHQLVKNSTRCSPRTPGHRHVRLRTPLMERYRSVQGFVLCKERGLRCPSQLEERRDEWHWQCQGKRISTDESSIIDHPSRSYLTLSRPPRFSTYFGNPAPGSSATESPDPL